MSSLLGALILAFTAVMVVATGIVAAYATVLAILQLMAPRRPQTPTRPLLVGQAHAAHAGAD